MSNHGDCRDCEYYRYYFYTDEPLSSRSRAGSMDFQEYSCLQYRCEKSGKVFRYRYGGSTYSCVYFLDKEQYKKEQECNSEEYGRGCLYLIAMIVLVSFLGLKFDTALCIVIFGPIIYKLFNKQKK